MISPTLGAPDVIIGRSARMRAVFEFLRVIGTSESTVLITGESGTGKEVTATLIHQRAGAVTGRLSRSAARSSRRR